MSLSLLRQPMKAVIQIFSLEDRFARDRGVNGLHPRPFGPFKFCVVNEMIADSPQPLAEPIELVVKRNPSGYHLFFGLVRLPTGETRRSYLRDGAAYTVRVQSAFYQPVERTVDIPTLDANSPVEIDLLPGYAYPFPKVTEPRLTLLRGHIHDSEKRGIQGVSVEIVGQPAPTYSMTDKTGQWLLLFPDTQPSGDVTIRFTLGGTTEERTVFIEQGRETSLTPVQFAM